MIYTVTLNPSLDYIIDVKHFEPGMVNRTTAEKIFAGGKGINVSHVLANLGMESVGLGFIAGFTGDVIEKGAKELGFAPGRKRNFHRLYLLGGRDFPNQYEDPLGSGKRDQWLRT